MSAARLTWSDLYRETDLYKAAVRLYTKPLFDRHKALSASSDERTLFDFARRGLKNLAGLHRQLAGRRFRFRPGEARHHNFNGKARTLYVYPWEERLVDLLLYRLLNRRLDRWFSPQAYAYRLNGVGVDLCQRRVARAVARAGGRPLYLVKRDIADYFASVDHRILFGQLAALAEPGDYLFRLLEQRVRFRFLDDGREREAARGVPFGTAIACFLANVHLTGLDRRLERVPGLFYCRYADDMLALSPDRSAASAAARIIEAELAALNLAVKPSHTHDLALSAGSSSGRGARLCAHNPAEDRFAPAAHFRHLGLEFRAGGPVGLSRDKWRKIRNLFRYAFRRQRRKLQRLKDPRRRAELAVSLARQVLERGVRNVAIIDYYLRHVEDEPQLRLLDRWLAEEVLSLAAGGGHRKGNFRLISYGELRALGLPSLVHRRRLLRHRHLASPFFIWKNYQQSRYAGGRAARPAGRGDPAGGAFFPGPEAAAAKNLVGERGGL